MRAFSLAWLVLFIFGQGLLLASEVPYYFWKFEAAEGFPEGPLQTGTKGLQVMVPEASIQHEDTAAVGQFLHLNGAVVLLGERVTGEGKTYLELWVCPSATEAGEGNEFLDFDGAAVGLFRDETGHAFLNAFHAGEDGQGYWLSTGAELPLDAKGRSQEWHRLTLVQEWQRGVWELHLDGMVVMTGLGRGKIEPGSEFELWLYGQNSAESPGCDFDDLLISALAPDSLENLQRAALKAVSRPQARSKTTTAQAGDQTRRQYRSPEPDRSIKTELLAQMVSVEIIGGGKQIGRFETSDESGKPKRFILYTASYDEAGKPKPLILEMRCDTSLAKGIRLEEIEWMVTDQTNDQQAKVTVISHGTFATGPIQQVKVPSEWSNKALSSGIGELGLTKRKMNH